MPKKNKEFIPRTKAQNSALHSLLAKHKFSLDDKAEMVYFYTDGRTEHSSEMSFDEANRMIHKLGGQPFTASPSSGGKSRRAVNLQNQKAGIKTIVSPTHIDLMNTLWRRRDGRTPDGLKALSQRIIKKDKPATSTECNKVIEAIKSMNSRDNALSFKRKLEPVASAGELFRIDISALKDVTLDINSTSRLWRFLLIDEYSRRVFIRFFFCPKPVIENVFEFLSEAYQLLGVPKFLYTDNDAIFKNEESNRAVSMLDKILEQSGGYKILHHSLGYTRASGTIEIAYAWSLSLLKLVSMHKSEGRHLDIDVLNRFAVWIAAEYNDRVHSATNETPLNRWESNHLDRTVKAELLKSCFVINRGEAA